MPPWLSSDPWLGGQLGKPAWRLDVGPAMKAGPEADFALATVTADPAFVYAKTGTADLTAAHWLEDRGFRLADTNLALSKPRGPGAAAPGIRMAKAGDEDAAVALGRSVFTLSRFHKDGRIAIETANRLKGEWVRNFFTGARGDAMVVAENAQTGQLQGFLQLLKTPDGTLVIDLIGVAADSRGHGRGAAMIAFAEQVFTDCPRLLVGTQAANQGSLRFYENLGFRMHSAHYVFHRHA